MRFTLKLLITLVVIILPLSVLIKIRDVNLQHKLAGTWVAGFPTGGQCTWRIEPDGSYSGQITRTNGSVINLEGTTKIKYGYLAANVGPRLGFLIRDTLTKTNETNSTVPYVSYYYIAQLNDREFVINSEIVVCDNDGNRHYSTMYRKLN